MKTNYILIDYENVRPKELPLRDGIVFKVLVFVGANQTKVDMELAKTIQSLGANAEYVQMSGNGPNALDFHIAFTVGELSKSEPDAYFHIISKDTGFDPLIQHARGKGIFIKRSETIAEIPLLKQSGVKSAADKIDAILRDLERRSSGKPSKVKTLTSTINALFFKVLEESELKSLVRTLEKRGHISIEGDKIRYHLPSTS